MRFEEILPALRAGKKVGRSSWDADAFLRSDRRLCVRTQDENPYILDEDTIQADDWEVIDDAPKTAGEALQRASIGAASLSPWHELEQQAKDDWERMAAAVLAWHASQRPPTASPEPAPPPAEGRSLGEIAYNAHDGSYGIASGNWGNSDMRCPRRFKHSRCVHQRGHAGACRSQCVALRDRMLPLPQSVVEFEVVSPASPPGFWCGEPYITVSHPKMVPGKRYRVEVTEEEESKR